MPQKTAVLLLQMGGPDSLDAVEPFLFNLFSDRYIIKIGPAFLQPLIARFIAKRRAPKVEGYYGMIGGKSPIRELTQAQAQALEAKLGGDYRCFVAMRYWRPTTIEALAAIKKEGISRIVVLSLYPHYSRATTGSSVNELKRVLDEAGTQFEVSYIDRFYDHPLPQSFIDQGDPYLSHIRETVRLVMERFGDTPCHLAFQSRAGPVKWLE